MGWQEDLKYSCSVAGMSIDDMGNKFYKSGDKFHRLFGPAIEWADGSETWYENGKLHRLDGPAVIRLDGYEAWYKNGKLHCLCGPAIIYSSGHMEWFINGDYVTLEEYIHCCNFLRGIRGES